MRNIQLSIDNEITGVAHLLGRALMDAGVIGYWMAEKKNSRRPADFKNIPREFSLRQATDTERT
jgi:hypothetical protein